jgi:hypothetical protein
VKDYISILYILFLAFRCILINRNLDEKNYDYLKFIVNKYTILCNIAATRSSVRYHHQCFKMRFFSIHAESHYIPHMRDVVVYADFNAEMCMRIFIYIHREYIET